MDLDQRVDRIEKVLEDFRELSQQNLRDDLRMSAYTMALQSMIMELAEKAGISRKDVIKHYNLRCQWWHDHYLKNAEDVNPSMAALIDDRSSEESGVDASYPPMFGEIPPSVE